MPLSITPISRVNTSMVMMNTPASLATDSAMPAPTATPRTVVSSADFALLPTLSGLDARVTLHGPGDAGPFTFTLAPDPRASLVQDAPNVIRVTRPVTTYGDDGSPQGIIQTEYLIQDPTALDSSPDPASIVRSGPVTMTLAPASSTEATGTREVAVTLDPAWLGDSRRVFPVTVDLPVVTADAAIHSGVFGTLDSCAPRQGAVQTALLVGREGAAPATGRPTLTRRTCWRARRSTAHEKGGAAAESGGVLSYQGRDRERSGWCVTGPEPAWDWGRAGSANERSRPR